MGDLIGKSVKGRLVFVPKNEFESLLSSKLDLEQKINAFSYLCRLNCLYMIAKAGSGHIGSSFSSMEIMSFIMLSSNSKDYSKYSIDSDSIFFSSKGHDSPALYSIFSALGILDFDKIHFLRRNPGLPGHPDVNTNGIFFNTGSLGMGISKAKGAIHANRLKGIKQKIYVLTGDGELQEGQFWESLISAANNNLEELTVIIDHNKLQSDTLVKDVSDLGDLNNKLRSFDWNVERCDGNDVNSLNAVFSKTYSNNKPKIIIADTIKGKGVSFMEHVAIDSDNEFYKFHSGAPTSDAYYQAVDELLQRINSIYSQYDIEEPEIDFIEQPEQYDAGKLSSLIPAYSKILNNAGSHYKNIVALDADLLIDTGLLDFKNSFPERFIECGIAEQDMVSQASGIAAKGLLPIVHSFACFLSTRANEQIYNNCTENRKVIYVGSLAGLLPGGPGHSHQSVRDISALGAIPNLLLLEPSCDKELKDLFEWSVRDSLLSTYIRLVSIPFQNNFDYKSPTSIKPGVGSVLKEGTDIAIFTYGPIFTSLISKVISENLLPDISIKLLVMPWLNVVDNQWLLSETQKISNVLVIDNHYKHGGLGMNISNAFLENSQKIRFKNLSLEVVPESGTNDEVLQHHSLDIDSILNVIKKDFNY